MGVGNCASALVQGIHYYSNVNDEKCCGIRNLFLGGFHPRDIKIVAAFDVDSRKVGRDLSEAIFAPPNNVPKMLDPPMSGVIVQKGPVLDGIGEYTKHFVSVSSLPEIDVAKVLEDNDVEIVLNLLPSGAVKASEWYAEQSLKAGCAFVNVTPASIASNAAWAKLFENAGLPIVGDDLIDQVGATTLHKVLLQLFSKCGVCITETYQLDVGGGTESLETLDRTRDLKRSIKTKTVKASLPYEAEVVAGSTDYVDFLQNRRDSYFWIKGWYFYGAPMQIDIRLSTVDAPNAGSVLFDVVRAVKIALNRKLGGAILSICAYAFKNPPKLLPLEEAEKLFTEFTS
ncbi:MAG: inositol-3-phosphate synthase [Candidatus Bathyarchaeota archaeon]|nr:inositol-3-phosphate synthase [Candidatus Bathyarchaeota archaeon]MCX8177719.1 inositol-3-phosphate synthase [Candidatus Bathyarchaeota archaeon]MDW8193980.1 inositol-3-phosphate synthase [Nitrososphaerota archaeon]